MYKDASTLERLREKLENTFMPKFEDLRASRASRPSIGKTLAWGVPGAVLAGPALARSPHSFRRLKKFLGSEMAEQLRVAGFKSPSLSRTAEQLTFLANNKVKNPWLKKIVERWAVQAKERSQGGNVYGGNKVVVDMFDDNMRGVDWRIGPTASPRQVTAADTRTNLFKALNEVGLGHHTAQPISVRELQSARQNGETLRDVLKRLYPHVNAKKVLAKKNNMGSSGMLGDMRERADEILNSTSFSDASDYVLEPFLKTKKMNPLIRMFNKTKLGAGLFQEVYGRAPHATREYRMHVVNGKVIPWATGSKWDPTSYATPFRTREIARLEKRTQRILDKMMEGSKTAKGMNLRKQVLGLDVGVGPRGRPIIFELNPTISSDVPKSTLGSGQILNPLFEDAIVSQAAGRMPIMQKIQLARDGAQAAIGGGLMYQGAKPWIPYAQQRRNQQKSASMYKQATTDLPRNRVSQWDALISSIKSPLGTGRDLASATGRDSAGYASVGWGTLGRLAGGMAGALPRSRKGKSIHGALRLGKGLLGAYLGGTAGETFAAHRSNKAQDQEFLDFVSSNLPNMFQTPALRDSLDTRNAGGTQKALEAVRFMPRGIQEALRTRTPVPIKSAREAPQLITEAEDMNRPRMVKSAISAGKVQGILAAALAKNPKDPRLIKKLQGISVKLLNRRTLEDGRMVPLSFKQTADGVWSGDAALKSSLLKRSPFKLSGKGAPTLYRSGDGYNLVLNSKSPRRMHIEALYHDSMPDLTTSRRVQSMLGNTSESKHDLQTKLLEYIKAKHPGRERHIFNNPKSLTEEIKSFRGGGTDSGGLDYGKLSAGVNTWRGVFPKGTGLQTHPGHESVRALYHRLGFAPHAGSKFTINKMLTVPGGGVSRGSNVTSRMYRRQGTTRNKEIASALDNARLEEYTAYRRMLLSPSFDKGQRLASPFQGFSKA